MNANELLKYRHDIYDDALRGKQPKRIPLMSSVNTWRIFDAGYNLSEALTDYDIMKKIVIETHQKYPFDGYTDFGLRNPIRITDAMGGSLYVIDDEKGSINYLDEKSMPAEDYSIFIKSYSKYMFERLIPARFDLQGPRDGLPKLKEAAKEMKLFQKFSSDIIGTMAEEYGALYRTTVRYNAPIEFMFNYVRGFKGISVDMRRNKEQLNAALKVLDEENLLPGYITKMDNTDTSKFYSNTCTTFLAHASMNPKQFEEFYWPYLKNALDETQKRDLTMWIFVEESLSRFLPFFQELGKRPIAFHLDNEDVYDIRRKFEGKLNISGGFPVSMLANSTTQECIDYAKKLIDDFAPEGGYIFGFDKMLSFRNDARSENLKAVCETVLSYGVRG